MTRTLLAMMAVTCLLAAGSAAADPYRKVTLRIAGATKTSASATNVNGTTVGEYADGSGTHGFSASRGTYRRIDAPGASGYTTASGINASGTIVGSFSSGKSGHGFMLKNGVFTELNYPGARFTTANAINSRDDVVGAYMDERRIVHGFIYSQGTFRPLDEPDAKPARSGLMTMATGVNDNGVVIGSYSSRRAIHGFTYAKGRFARLDASSSALSTHLAGITNDGTIAGSGYSRDGEEEFVLFQGLYRRHIDASDLETEIQSINDRGVLTVRIADATPYSILMIPTGPGPRPILWLGVMAATLLSAIMVFVMFAWRYSRSHAGF